MMDDAGVPLIVRLRSAGWWRRAGRPPLFRPKAAGRIGGYALKAWNLHVAREAGVGNKWPHPQHRLCLSWIDLIMIGEPRQ